MKIVEEQIPSLIREQNDKQVLAHLYKELFPSVQRFIKKNNGIADDAYDVFQDALMYFYKQVMNNSFNSKYNVYGYIYRLSINRWINKIHKSKKIIYKPEFAEDFSSDSSFRNFGEVTDSKSNDRNILGKFVSFIGEKCVEMMTLRIYSNLMFEDIGLRLGYNSEAATKMQFKRCREKLVDALKSNPVLAKQLRNHE